MLLLLPPPLWLLMPDSLPLALLFVRSFEEKDIHYHYTTTSRSINTIQLLPAAVAYSTLLC